MSKSQTKYMAKLWPMPAEGLQVSQLVTNRVNPTPGNVGVCLSGGGSRALTAGMGQLRALKHLTTANGVSLLSQTKALSTVSGGSWIGVAFEYLDGSPTDDDYLNNYVADPALRRSPPKPKANLKSSSDLKFQGSVPAN